MAVEAAVPAVVVAANAVVPTAASAVLSWSLRLVRLLGLPWQDGFVRLMWQVGLGC